MLTIIAAIIAIGGIFIELHPRYKYSFIEQICIGFASMCAGGFVMGQNYIALFYSFMFIISGLIYHTYKVFYHVVQAERVK